MYYDKACKHMLIRLLTEIIYCGLRSYNLAAPRYITKFVLSQLKNMSVLCLLLFYYRLEASLKLNEFVDMQCTNCIRLHALEFHMFISWLIWG